MNVLRSVEAYYPAFHLGGDPVAVRCTIAIVEANGRKYLKTPFAMLDAHADDDIERQMGEGRGYYATEAECNAYLAREYPWHEQARPIMNAVMDGRHHYGDIVAAGRLCDAIGLSPCGNDLYMMARGHKRFGLKAIRKAVRDLTACRLAV